MAEWVAAHRARAREGLAELRDVVATAADAVEAAGVDVGPMRELEADLEAELAGMKGAGD